MSEDLASPINSDSGQGPITEQRLPASPKEREPARLPSDAALKRRQEGLFGPALWAAEPTWDALEFQACFCSIMLPLEEQIRKRARTHRHSAGLFWKSVDRLMQKRCRTDSVYRRDYERYQECAVQEQKYFQEQNPTSPIRKLSKDQKRKRARMVDFVERFVPRGRPIVSEAHGKEAIEVLTALAKKGRGRTPDADSEKIVRLSEGGTRAHSQIAEKMWPSRWASATPNERGDLKRRVAKTLYNNRKSVTH